MTTTITGNGIDKVQDGIVQNASLAAGVPGKSKLPAGTVLQVVQSVLSDVFTSSSSSWVDITSLSVSITPTSASSKILVTAQLCVSCTGGTTYTHSWFRFTRNGTAIGISTNPLSGQIAAGAWIASPNQYSQNSGAMNYLDSPATTSALTYKVQIYNQQSGYITCINRTGDDSNNANVSRTISTITVMEIAA